jgi:regulator of PEP synthase PpsR (kinase-PPPase family)
MVHAALVQYSDQEVHIIRSKNVRTVSQVDAVIDEVAVHRGLIAYTVVSPDMRAKIQLTASERNIPAIDLLGPLLAGLDQYLGIVSHSGEAGKLRTVDEQYYQRIEAIEFAVKADDGKNVARLREADIILVGISRTSKTPLSIFLSHKGYKVANVPMVHQMQLPEELFEVDQRKIVGLIIDPETLYRIRRNRLEKFGQDPGAEYASKEHIHEEIDFAMKLFRKNRRWPVFNVTDRALEETATEIIRIVSARMGWKSEKFLF